MPNPVVRQIPNAITCCNLISGCVAAIMALHGDYEWAMVCILTGALFDFFDGMTARLLGVSGPMGVELDSLADDITFGLAPSMVMFSMMQTATSQLPCQFMTDVFPYTAFLIAAFSALRLGKFNIDTRQKTSFIGLPTPANAIFLSSFAVCYQDAAVSAWALLAIVVVFSLLLVAEIPMFSLKLKNLTWRDNSIKYVFLVGCVVLVLLLGVSHVYALVVWYILLSLAMRCFARK
ncbi:MAG: CDP-diacylglycerol--serine O-phosphatidyltransferase [Bacteroidales bacterium]|nr:CDP-diacylglycerol--serine O-phosphatidyltransferase [Bacteroidales bacterium]